jgi:putative hydrolase of the HAD superfamily
MTPLSCVFFDAAGTLFQLREPVGQTYAREAAARGFHADPAALEAGFRAAWKAAPAPLHPEGSPPEDDDADWWRALVTTAFTHALHPAPPPGPQEMEPLFAALYTRFRDPALWSLYDDVLPALDLLQGRSADGTARWRLFVLSNFDRRLHSILAGLGIASRFESVILSSEVGASKPHPRIFRAALQAAGVPADLCLHIGDDETCDLEGARQAGLHARLVQRPGTSLLDIAKEVVKNSI